VRRPDALVWKIHELKESPENTEKIISIFSQIQIFFHSPVQINIHLGFIPDIGFADVY
jgi:hypothetical protein